MVPSRCREAGTGWCWKTDDLVSLVEKLRQSGARVSNEIVSGPGGKQILVNDPSGNPVELFESSGG